MVEVIPNEIRSSIFYYKTGSFEVLQHDRNLSCEDVCRELCRRWNISPLVQLLFGLRIHGRKIWLAGCRQLSEGIKYEFRIRFKVPKLSDLNQLDKNTYDYFYHQVRFDVLNDAIPEIAYPNYKNDILGLCVTDMYVEMIENNRKVEYLKKNYQDYIPKELAKHHSVFAKRKIKASLKSIRNKEHDVFYVKGIYLQQIDAKAPNYLTEEYQGITPCPKEDDLKQGNCCVQMQIAPFHPDEPGLRIHYPHKNAWKHVSNFADFYTIEIDETKNEVRLEIQNNPQGFPITMDSRAEIESFVSGICGYYRLMVKWNMDLCSQLSSPTLEFLNHPDRKIHGPIGGAYSYSKIEEKNSSIGSFIIRQCEKVFDTFYIDIVTKENQPETFKITYKPAGDRWTLHLNDNNECKDFDELLDLARSIPTNGSYFRLPPTPYDKSPKLLLCRPPSKLTKELGNVRSSNPLLLRAVDDLLLYRGSQKDCSDGHFTRMKAEFNQPNGKRMNVTLKILKPTEVNRLSDFVMLADKWAKLDLSEIVKMHGITLHQPISLVLESIQVGPLDEFLRKHRKDITLLDLVETSYTLAKALHYLQENRIVHGYIRCSTLQVVNFIPNCHLVVKLGDPGLPIESPTVDDVPWIAIEDYGFLADSRKNLKSDIWAYATTLWEIFSRGEPIKLQNPMQFFISGKRLPKPIECSSDPLSGIYNLMLKGWDVDPERRFSPQKIIPRLLEAKTKLSRDYSEPNTMSTSSGVSSSNITTNGSARRSAGLSDYYNGSMLSAETDHTYITSHTNTTIAYIENPSLASNQSHDGGSSQVSLLNGNSSNGSQSTIACYGNDFDDFDGIPSVIEFSTTRLIFQGEIGRGNYGRVFRGSMESFDEPQDERQVAIKLFRTIESTEQFRDFQREAKIMKSLEHENIVKIYGYREEPLLIIMEYITHGALLQYLSIQRPNLTEKNLLEFAANIAKGMHYLEQKKIVHRDLAARNVLVANEHCVKIADFGLAQITDGSGYYYHSTNSRALPLKWYAPETLREHKFSHKSDVWSFGVTLYEMFTFGDSPNLSTSHDLNATEILDYLEKGRRLAKPRFCAQNVYDELMKVCWNINHKLRPSFAELVRTTEQLCIVNGEAV